METLPLVGCCGYPGNPQRYQRELSLVELQQSFRLLPQLKTARRWRASARDGFAFSLKAWQLITHLSTSPTYRGLKPKELLKGCPRGDLADAGHFRDSEVVRWAWERTKALAESLEAKAIVFESPSDFTPTADNRKRLETFFETLDRPEGCHLVWDPRGLWERQTSQSIADALGIVLCHDGESTTDPALGSYLAVGDPCYMKLRHASLGGEDLERLAPALMGCTEAYVLLATNDSYAWARRLRLVLADQGSLTDLEDLGDLLDLDDDDDEDEDRDLDETADGQDGPLEVDADLAKAFGAEPKEG